MAKYTITHTCGHTVTHQIFGSNSKGQRDSKIAWLETTLCRECWEAEQLAKNQAAREAKNRPVLEGTPKQVQWAMDIAENADFYISRIVEETQKFMEHYQNEADKVSILEQILGAVQGILNNPDAKFWIDNRDGLITALVHAGHGKNMNAILSQTVSALQNHGLYPKKEGNTE